jgi:dTDP-4-amino-4,6-dideoxygalactose transaminase
MAPIISTGDMSKNRLEDLAVYGGPPTFSKKLHVGRPNIGDRAKLLERVNNILDNRWLTNNGPYVQEFEQRIADMIGVRHCVAMCNATVALEITIRALELSGEVIVPSFTFVATAHALQWQEMTPVFSDIDPKSHNLDPARVEQMITPRTSAIIGVHLWGRACNVEALASIAASRGLKLLFDAAHAFGCSHKGRMIGGFGDAEVFSFHATKFFNTFEGGAVTTNDDALAAKLRLMKNLGFSDYDQVISIGTNGKMNEIAAAMGLTNLESVDDFIEVNRRNYKQYSEELAGLEGIRLLTYDEKERSNYQYAVLEVDERKTIVTRDQLMKILHKENVLARRYFYPGCHRMEPYRSYFPEAGTQLKETEKLAKRVLCLPTGTALNAAQLSLICRIIRFVVNNGGDISRKLNNQEISMIASR